MEILKRVQQRTTKVIKGLGHHSYKERLRDLSVQSGKEKAQGHLIKVYRNLKGGCRENGSRHFLVPSDWIRGNGYKLKQGRFLWLGCCTKDKGLCACYCAVDKH